MSRRVSIAASATSNEENRERRRSSVDNLERLYTIVLGLALVRAVEVLLIGPGGGFAVQWRSLPMFVAFVATLIPFYHGANRYLFTVYVFLDYGEVPRRVTALIDFIFFFVQAMIFFAMALVIDDAATFYVLLTVQLLWDCLWMAVVQRLGSAIFATIFPWLRLNLVVSALLVAVLATRDFGNAWAGPLWLPSELNDRTLWWGVATVIALVRTVLDYRGSWEFYWPGFSPDA